MALDKHKVRAAQNREKVQLTLKELCSGFTSAEKCVGLNDRLKEEDAIGEGTKSGRPRLLVIVAGVFFQTIEGRQFGSIFHHPAQTVLRDNNNNHSHNQKPERTLPSNQ